ncbi:hypothetical protein B1992_02530 [Pseudoxanthomonas broegbernensis]|uniref:DUF6602 domain-containing protein n=1 Tax=Pseudoxanthomonas broegbernensis TaxID=83619 RepID=A0A7V8GP80_9GAMM|nr:DUF6602 domain-containing protein [Pseudoxanthomonas broegbernensis]KAF1687560.1 hypothetical protein B1992_02530 [Pseudoxanthomonas broegbernensis]MBB6064571.1 hypothetical protein [Pseudoxanthomonas broegbernensis]
MTTDTDTSKTALNAPQGDVSWMRQAFEQVQSNLAATMKLASQSISHGGVMGSVNEEHWADLFRKYLPNRYDVATGIVIDSRGNRSEQIDLVIFDRHFTPTLLDQKSHRYIPAEAVYAVFECKPTINKDYLDYAEKKAASVRAMHRTSVTIAHAGGTYEPKPHFRILAGILAPDVSWADGLGEAFERNLSADPDAMLDCGVALDRGCFDRYEGVLSIANEQGALMYFLFRLLARLQSLGTVPAIDWAAYSRIIRP